MVSLVCHVVILSSWLRRCLLNFPDGIQLSLSLIPSHSEAMLWDCDKAVLFLTLSYTDCGSFS